MRNEFEKYWVVKEVDWHAYVPHHYHVSQIGVSHDDLEPNEHSGPCLRQSFYKIKVPVNRQVGSKGNLTMGTLLHRELQDIQKKNVPMSIIEFPLFGRDGDITFSGSVDIVEWTSKSSTIINICDAKSASSYTLPKHSEDYNPTYFSQIYLYAYIITTFYLTQQIVEHLRIIYVDKHNLATYEIDMDYDPVEGKKNFDNFIQRCHLLDSYLEANVLPPKEPMKWCVYCDWKALCNSDCVSEEDIESLTEDEVKASYTEKTGKSPFWRNNLTKAYISFRSGFKIED